MRIPRARPRAPSRAEEGTRRRARTRPRSPLALRSWSWLSTRGRAFADVYRAHSEVQIARVAGRARAIAAETDLLASPRIHSCPEMVLDGEPVGGERSRPRGLYADST